MINDSIVILGEIERLRNELRIANDTIYYLKKERNILAYELAKETYTNMGHWLEHVSYIARDAKE